MLLAVMPQQERRHKRMLRLPCASSLRVRETGASTAAKDRRQQTKTMTMIEHYMRHYLLNSIYTCAKCAPGIALV